MKKLIKVCTFLSLFASSAVWADCGTRAANVEIAAANVQAAIQSGDVARIESAINTYWGVLEAYNRFCRIQ